jgi:hypothetical protein
MLLLINLSSRVSSGDKDYNLVLVTIEEAFDLVCKYLESRRARGRISASLFPPPSYEANTNQDSNITVSTFLRPIHSRLRIYILLSSPIRNVYKFYDYYLLLNPDIPGNLISNIKALME